MPSWRPGTLRVESEGGWPVSDSIEFLETIRSTYNGLLAIAAILDSYSEENRRSRYRHFPEFEVFQPALPSDLSADGVASLIRPQDQLILSKVRLSSPGFWEFLGALNPLEVIRRFIDDCHRRRQDREYREANEQRRLELENDILETEMLRRRIQLAREVGIPEYQLTQLLNRLVYQPMQRIETLSARGIISRSSSSEVDPDAPS